MDETTDSERFSEETSIREGPSWKLKDVLDLSSGLYFETKTVDS